MTGALTLLVTLLLFGTVHDPFFPKERLFPSAVSTLMQMFLKSEIVLMKRKCKELYSVMNSVNDIYILGKKIRA